MSTEIDRAPVTITYWTKSRFDESVAEHYNDMKQHGWTKAQAKKDIINMMLDNNLKIQK